MRSIADRVFDGFRAESELGDMLDDAGIEHDRLGHDSYDCSLEIHGVAPDVRLSDEVQKIISDAGFIKCYVNHTDKWETHYSWKSGVFLQGFRVSYPHKRGEKDGAIWVEHHVPSWSQDWFDTGHVVVKPAQVTP